VGDALLDAAKGKTIPPATKNTRLRHGRRVQKRKRCRFQFRAGGLPFASLVPTFSRALAKARAEVFFNQMEPFYNAMVIYVLAGLLAFFRGSICRKRCAAPPSG
jgi:hypothetical protein